MVTNTLNPPVSPVRSAVVFPAVAALYLGALVMLVAFVAGGGALTLPLGIAMVYFAVAGVVAAKLAHRFCPTRLNVVAGGAGFAVVLLLTLL